MPPAASSARFTATLASWILYPFWLIGAALWFLPDISARWRWLALLFVAAALLFGRLEISKTHFWFRDLFLAATFSFLLVTFRNLPMPRSGTRAAVAGYFAATGHYRDGILLAPVTAQIMTALLTGSPTNFKIETFSPMRFE